MARGLYRVYLYLVTIALAVFATVIFASLLGKLFSLTPLRGESSAPTNTEITQSVVQFIVTAIIVAALGGLHYWLIRRDMATDPQPGASGVRAFFLNISEGVAALVAINLAVISLAQIGAYYAPDIAGSLAAAIAALVLTLTLAWERLRATPTQGAALIFQRLRMHGVPLILLITVGTAIYTAVNGAERLIGQATGLIQCVEPGVRQPFDTGVFLPTCTGNEQIGQWLAALVAVGAWLGYLWLGRRDTRSLLRQVLLLLGWTAGMVTLTIASVRGVDYVLRLTLPGATPPDYLQDFNFTPILVFAAVALAVYGWALRITGAEVPMSLDATRLTMRALGSAVLAVAFWIGMYLLIWHAITRLSPGVGYPTRDDWATALAPTIIGALYIPLALWLGVGSRTAEINGPRRGFVLALLAAGALVTAGAAATLLYSIATQFLGAPLSDWQSVARQAGAALIVGVTLGGVYLWTALRERQFIPAHKPEEPAAPAASPAETLDGVLTQLREGAISQTDAAERIRTLAREGTLA